MRKLLHLVFAVWKTDRPFDENHFPWEDPAVTPRRQRRLRRRPAAGAIPAAERQTAVGHKRDLPAEEVVTTATSTVEPAPPPVKPASPPTPAARPQVDFAFLREQVTMEQVLRASGARWGSCAAAASSAVVPARCTASPRTAERTFSVHLGKNVFQCFHADCGLKGNVLDLWAAIHRLPLYEAALHLAETFRLPRNREEEPVTGTRADVSGRSPPSGGQAVATHDMLNR